MTFIESTIEEADLGEARFDCIFSRWVFSFLGDLDPVLAKLRRALKPGGVLVIQDYNHEGVSVFPESAGFEAAIRATRAFYRGAGGDPWVAARLPGPLRRSGFELEEIRPHVRAGNGESPVFRWLDAFFPTFVRTYAEAGLMSEEEVESFDEEWAALARNPDALLFSPMIVDVIARRPLGEGATPRDGEPMDGGSGKRWTPVAVDPVAVNPVAVNPVNGEVSER